VKELIAALLVWIGQNSEYRNLAAPRYWMELPQEQIDSRARADAGHGRAGTLAMYECDSHTLVLRAGFDFERAWERSILLHELVHHVQCLRHGRYDDLCAAEREAYALQAKFLRAAMAHGGVDDAALEQSIAIVEQEPDRVCALLKPR
jgi:hypothetical protein